MDIAWRKRKLNNLKELANKILDQLPKNLPTSKVKEKKRGKVSETEIESEDVYQSNDNLKNNLREKE